MKYPTIRHYACFLAVLSCCRGLDAATYSVSPTGQYKDLQAVADKLQPGDVVEVQGGARYAGPVSFTKHGTTEQKITIRGLAASGKRPVLAGGEEFVVELLGSHYVFEGFEITDGPFRGLYHHADDVTIRDCVIHHCGNGLMGAMQDSGSLTLEYCEIYKCGQDPGRHPIYMDTDAKKFPQAVFRLQHCYIHDSTGGDMVKTRARRNEIYYNWLEGSTSRELELVGGEHGNGRAEYDSDVVGNVIVHSSDSPTARCGHDARGRGANGKYRFVNNTVISAKYIYNPFGTIHSIESHNNVFVNPKGGPVTILDVDYLVDAKWIEGRPVITGSNNWVPEGTKVPDGWKGTIVGKDPGLADLAKLDLRPARGSPLLAAGVEKTVSPDSAKFPDPLALPLMLPPMRKLENPGQALRRPNGEKIDIGAFPLPSPTTAPAASQPSRK